LSWLESDEELGKAAGMCRDEFRKVIAKKTMLRERRAIIKNNYVKNE
jgi:hypothetical protein